MYTHDYDLLRAECETLSPNVHPMCTQCADDSLRQVFAVGLSAQNAREAGSFGRIAILAKWFRRRLGLAAPPPRCPRFRRPCLRRPPEIGRASFRESEYT